MGDIYDDDDDDDDDDFSLFQVYMMMMMLNLVYKGLGNSLTLRGFPPLRQ